MSMIPPPLPKPSAPALLVGLAHASWASVVVAIALTAIVNAGTQFSHDRMTTVITGIGSGLIALIGLISGIVALISMAWYGRRGIIIPALAGLAVWLLLAAIAVPSFMHARALALARQAPVQLAPAVFIPAAEKLRDADLGFTLDVPKDYIPFPKGKVPPDRKYAYVKPGGVPAKVILIKTLPSVIPKNQRLGPSDLPPGKGITIIPFQWRGLELNGMRVPEKSAAGDYVTFNFTIPLKKQGILLSLGGPAGAEAEIRALADKVLWSLDGETNW